MHLNTFFFMNLATGRELRRRMTLTSNSLDLTPVIGVAFKAGQALARGLMIDSIALGVDATRARAGVDALEVAARHVTRAVGVNHALGSTLGVRVAEVIPDALAVVGCGAPAFALGVEATGRRRAGVVGGRCGWGGRGSCKHAGH